ncbi:MAG: hypothetical protein RBR74_11590, partial [Ignavibacteriaceae bacterium]|nr:hypothetical protein [Ignavibacteriaceae bacterium]
VIPFIILFLSFASCDVVDNDKVVKYECNGNDSVGVWKFLGLENETITAIAVHPQKPNIIFAGTSKDFSAGIPGRLYRSDDCGRTWQVLFEAVGFKQSVNQILFDPGNPNIIYAIPHPILKSTDGGSTWADISNGIRLDWETSVQSIAMNPASPDILYAGTGGFFGGTLYKSTDSGKSWENLYRNEDETPGLRDGVISLVIDPTNSNVIYAGTAWRGLILKSTDSGFSWIISRETHQLINNLIIDYNSSQVVYAAVSYDGFLRSLDNGNSWQIFNEGLGDTVYGIKLRTNPINSDVYGLASKDSLGMFIAGLYIKKQSNLIWEEINISNIIISYYSDIYVTEDGKYLFLGSYSGAYKIKLE